MWYCDTGEMKMFPGKFRKNEYIFFVMHFHWSWNTYKMKDTVIKTSEPNLLLKKNVQNFISLTAISVKRLLHYKLVDNVVCSWQRYLDILFLHFYIEITSCFSPEHQQNICQLCAFWMI